MLIRALPFCVAAALLPSAASAACAPHDVAVKALKDTYGEVQVMLALVGPGPDVLEIFANLATHTWTVLITDPAGTACSPASGTQYTPVPPGDPA